MIVDKVTAANLAASAAPAAALPNSARHAQKRWAMLAQECGTPYQRLSLQVRYPIKPASQKTKKSPKRVIAKGLRDEQTLTCRNKNQRVAS